jgi:hypothetical protein
MQDVDFENYFVIPMYMVFIFKDTFFYFFYFICALAHYVNKNTSKRIHTHLNYGQRDKAQNVHSSLLRMYEIQDKLRFDKFYITTLILY